MSFKEIKELRQAGKLDEALQMANQALEAEPDNILNKRAAAWVYYDYLKKYAQPDSFDAFKDNLIKIKNLQLPDDKKMIFDNCTWQIGSILFSLHKSEHVDYGKINEVFEIIRDFHITKPSEAYSFIYKAFHSLRTKTPRELDHMNHSALPSECGGTQKVKPKVFLSVIVMYKAKTEKKIIQKHTPL